MELEELKNLWDKKNDPHSNKLEDEHILPLLKKKREDIFSQLNRSILISVGIIGIIILYNVLVNIFTPQKYLEAVPYINFISYIEFLLDVFFVIIFLNFLWTYSKIKKIEIADEHLKSILEKVLFALKSFKRTYYFGLFIAIPSFSIIFSYGMYYGIVLRLAEQGKTITELPYQKFIFMIFICSSIILAFTIGTYLLSKWLFKRLYGNYLSIIEQDLKELKEKI